MTGMPPQLPPGMGQGPAPAQGMPSPQQGQPGQFQANPGVDPQNSMMGVPNQAPPASGDGDVDFGSVPANTDPGHQAIIRAMHNAYANKGVNPYDSHPEMKKKWERAWKDKANRDAIKAAGGMKSGPAAVAGGGGNPQQQQMMMQKLKQALAMRGLSSALPIKR